MFTGMIYSFIPDFGTVHYFLGTKINRWFASGYTYHSSLFAAPLPPPRGDLGGFARQRAHIQCAPFLYLFLCWHA
jgi:hypothetical protein